MKIYNKDEEVGFRMKLLRDIPYFQHLYAKYHDSQWLEIAKTLGEVTANLKRRNESL